MHLLAELTVLSGKEQGRGGRGGGEVIQIYEKSRQRVDMIKIYNIRLWNSQRKQKYYIKTCDLAIFSDIKLKSCYAKTRKHKPHRRMKRCDVMICSALSIQQTFHCIHTCWSLVPGDCRLSWMQCKETSACRKHLLQEERRSTEDSKRSWQILNRF